MKTTHKVFKALEDVWRWREALTTGGVDLTVEERLRAISKRGDEAARHFGFDDVRQEEGSVTARVAEAGGTYDVGRNPNPVNGGGE